MKRMNMFILIAVTLLSCGQDGDSTEEVETTKLLTTKTIEIEQQIDGQMVSRSVIIQAPAVSDAATKYPLVFAFHGRGGNNNHWVNTLKSVYRFRCFYWNIPARTFKLLELRARAINR